MVFFRKRKQMFTRYRNNAFIRIYDVGQNSISSIGARHVVTCYKNKRVGDNIIYDKIYSFAMI